MNRKLSLVVVIALLALLVLTLSASGVIARAAAQPAEVIAQPQVSPCTVDFQVARLRVFGQVFDAQGTARAGLRIQAVGPDGRSRIETRTRASGHYNFPSLPAGRYTLRVLDERGQPLLQADGAEVMAVEARQGVRRDLFLASSKDSTSPLSIQSTGQITGVVTASNTGLPLADVSVTAYDAATGSYKASDYTDSQGKYIIDALATGSYKVGFSPFSYGAAEDYLDQFYNNQTSLDTATPVNVTDGQVTPNISAVLQPGGQITGRVTAADTHNPLEDVSVYVSGGTCSDAWSGSASTDANGVYTVTAIPTGNYKVHFDPGYSSSALTEEYIDQYYNNKSSSTATPVAVTAPHVVNNIDAALVRGGQIKGRVTNQSNVGLPEVDVSADGVNYGYASTSTDATGAYTITGLVSDTYRVEFFPSSYGTSKDYAYQFYNSKTTWTTANTVTVTAPAVTPNVNQVLPLGSRITGRVTTADTSLPMQNADISVYTSDGISEDYVTTNASGVYTTSALPVGNYRIRFSPSYAQQITYTRQYYNSKVTLASADVVSVTAPNSVVSNINAALARGGQISGTIIGADTGLPLDDFYVAIYPSTGSSSVAYAYSDAHGAYLTPALPPGDYKVWFGGITDSCTGKCYTGQYYNNKPNLGSATIVNVVVSQVTKNINATLAVCATSPTPPSSVSLSGPVTGTAISSITFNATVSPSTATTPITYTWQATGKSLVTHTGGGTSDTIGYAWSTTGPKTITVTATNAFGSATNSRTITIDPSTIVLDHWIYLPTVRRQ